MVSLASWVADTWRSQIGRLAGSEVGWLAAWMAGSWQGCPLAGTALVDWLSTWMVGWWLGELLGG